MNKEQILEQYNHAYEIIFPEYKKIGLSFSSNDEAIPFLQMGRNKALLIVRDRGKVVKSKEYTLLEDLIFDIFYDLTFEKSCDMEALNRIDPRLDSRILIFQYQADLMGRYSLNWRKRTEDRISSILSEFPLHAS